MLERINGDANANYGLLPEVSKTLKGMDWKELGNNPSSIHWGGQKARALVEEAREEVGHLINLKKGDRIIFTSGATEANNTALFSMFWKKPGVVMSAVTEHPSVLTPLNRLSQLGNRVVWLKPKQLSARYEVEDVLEAMSPETNLVSLMYANNETGHINPISEIASALNANFPNAIFHSDTVQALGKVSLDFQTLGVQMLSLSAHKIGGLPGTGALVFSENLELEPFLLGGPQEQHSRAGTENVLGIYAFGVAARIVRENLSKRISQMEDGVRYLKQNLIAELSDIEFNCKEPCLPNTLSVRIQKIKADDLVVALDLEGVAISSGAACASGKPEPSHVLLAMGLTSEQATETVRISLEAENQSLERLLETIIKTVKRMREN